MITQLPNHLPHPLKINPRDLLKVESHPWKSWLAMEIMPSVHAVQRKRQETRTVLLQISIHLCPQILVDTQVNCYNLHPFILHLSNSAKPMFPSTTPPCITTPHPPRLGRIPASQSYKPSENLGRWPPVWPQSLPPVPTAAPGAPVMESQ